MKDSKLPMWPLYAADALMFAAVFIISLPSVRFFEKLGFSDTLFCTFMVLAGMGMLLFPYWLEYKRDLAKKSERAAEADENFEIIFNQLSELQLMIAESEEKRENLSFSVEELKLNADTKAIVAAVDDFKEAVKLKFKEFAQSQDSNAQSATSCQSAIKETSEAISGIIAEMEILKDMISATNETLGDEVSELSASIAKFKGDFEDSKDSEEVEEKNAPKAVSKVGSMLGKALEQAEDTKASVAKFTGLSATASKLVSESSPVESEDGDVLGDDADELQELEDDSEISGEESQSSEHESAQVFSRKPYVYANDGEEYDDEPSDTDDSRAEEQTDADGDKIEDEQSDSVEDEIEDSTNDAEDNLEAEKETKDRELDFFEQADSDAQASESALKNSAATANIDKEMSDMLFDSLPETPSKPQKPQKSDAAITVNALIGIGNKPYLRGNGAGMSADKGVPMDFVEIGKWRYVFKDLSDTVRFTVLKNDETPDDGAQEFELEPGRKMEINLSFPQI